MRYRFILAAVLVCGCRVMDDAARRDRPDLPRRDAPSAEQSTEMPAVNVPLSARQRNYRGGSCVHASTITLFRWQGRDDLAELWRRRYSGGEGPDGLAAKLRGQGVDFAYVTDGDVGFLEWAASTRRGAGICYWPNHYVCLVHLDRERAGLLDNNRIDRIIWINRDEFVRNWRRYGGWACTPVYSPAPPLPTWKRFTAATLKMRNCPGSRPPRDAARLSGKNVRSES